MLTREEEKVLNALREHMDDEQKEVFDEMSDEEKKEIAKEARKEIEKAKKKYDTDTIKGRFNLMRDTPYRAWMKEHGENGPIAATIFWLVLRMTRSKAGCITLLVIVAVIAIAIAIGANS